MTRDEGGAAAGSQASEPGDDPSTSQQPPKKSLFAIVVVVLIAIAVVAAVAIAVVSVVGGGEEADDASSDSSTSATSEAVDYGDSGFSTAEEAATAYAKAVTKERSASTLDELLEARYDILECWHPAVLAALLADSGSSDYEEFVINEVYGSTTEAEALVYLYSRLYGDGCTFSLEPGEALDASDLKDLQDELDDLGLGLQITSACEITGSYTKTASDGTKTTSTVGFSGTYLIEIDGAWYIWTDFEES